MEDQPGHNGVSDEVVQLPAPTAWPIVLALGLTFAFAGLVTNVGISVLGAVLIVAGCVGWFGQVWPHAHHIAVPVKSPEVRIHIRAHQGRSISKSTKAIARACRCAPHPLWPG